MKCGGCCLGIFFFFGLCFISSGKLAYLSQKRYCRDRSQGDICSAKLSLSNQTLKCVWPWQRAPEWAACSSFREFCFLQNSCMKEYYSSKLWGRWSSWDAEGNILAKYVHASHKLWAKSRFTEREKQLWMLNLAGKFHQPQESLQVMSRWDG